MSTIECTREEFNQAFIMFHKEIGIISNSQESIGNLWKGLVLHYLGMQNASDRDIELSATMLKVAFRDATYRGWTLEEPDLYKPEGE